MAERLTRGVALLATPLLVLGSAHELYLRNQRELGGQLAVLAPFWAAGLAAVAAGLALPGLLPARVGLAARWAYHATGLTFLAWAFLRGLEVAQGLPGWVLDRTWGTAALVLLVASAIAFLGRRVAVTRVEPAMAALAVVLAAGEAWRFATRLERHPAPPPAETGLALLARAAGDRPNIYHVVLDGFPDDLFAPALGPGQLAAFAGFVRFPATRALALATRESMATVLTGRTPGRAPSFERALADDRSLPAVLRRAGYARLGVVPRSVYGQAAGAFEAIVFHDQNGRSEDTADLDAQLFRRLWLLRVLPADVVRRLARGHPVSADPDFLRSLAGQRLSTYTQPVESATSFRRFAGAEGSYPRRGRYTLVHVLAPHAPFVLRADCSTGGGTRVTDVLEQTRCALALTGEFLEALRRHGRYDEATVLIHGDHGSGHAWRGGRPVTDDAASARTLLLIKPARATGRLRESPEAATLADIAPTLLALLGVAGGMPDADGRALDTLR